MLPVRDAECAGSSRMLKKSLFSPTQPQRAETRIFPCGVLASLRGSTRVFGSRKHWRGFPVHQDLLGVRTAPRSAVRTSSPLRSLRPCWTAFLSTLSVFWLQPRTEHSNHIFGINRVFPQPARRAKGRALWNFFEECVEAGSLGRKEQNKTQAKGIA
jgi:hypothetical protein